MRRSAIHLGISIASLVAAGLLALFADKPGCTKHEKAECEMGEIQKALNLYALNHARYPTSLTDLTEQFPNGVPANPYTKRPYEYVTDGGQFVLVCYGRDDAPGGDGQQNRDIAYTELGRLR